MTQGSQQISDQELVQQTPGQQPAAEQTPAATTVQAPPPAVPAAPRSVSENGVGADGAVPPGESETVPAPTAIPAPVAATPPGAAPAEAASARAAMPAPAPRVLTLEEMQVAEKAGALVMAARSAQRRGQKEAARAALRQALQLAPSDAGALEVLGDLYFEEGEQAKAIAVFEKGLRHHPRHTSFEEKIAVAKLDLAEMDYDRMRREQFLEHGDTEKWQDRNPGLAGSLSLVLPGAGQAYNDEYERGGVMFGVALFSLIAWYWPLTSAMRSVTENQTAGYRPSVGEIASTALREMGAGGFFVYLMLFTWAGTHLYSAWDAAQLAITAAEARKRDLGIS